MLKVSEIKQFIDDDATSEEKRLAKIGQRYYEAEHDIMECRFFFYNADGILEEDKTRSNVKISHPFFTELSDQLASFMLSVDGNPIQAKEKTEGLQEQLDNYFDDEFWAEITDLITGTYNKGFDYIYGYTNEDNRLAFQYADGMGVVEVRKKDTDDGCEYIIYWYIDRIEKGQKEIKKIQVWSDSETYFYVQDGDTGEIIPDESVEINPRPHVVYTDEKTGKRMGYPLGYIPFWRLDNNRKKVSGLKPIKRLIDDYDIHSCSLSNNLIDFDTPLHIVRGFQGDNLEELQQNIKTKKMIGVDEGGGVEISTINIPYQARKEKLDIDEANIYRFGMGLNTFGLKDTAATTNLAIQASYTLLELKANKLEKQLKKLLKQIIKVVLAEINEKNDTDYQLTDVTFNFKRAIMTNETENIQNELIKANIQQIKANTVMNVAQSVGDEQTLKAICEVMDWDFDEIKGQLQKMQAEQSLIEARAALEGAIPEEPITEPIPEGDLIE